MLTRDELAAARRALGLRSHSDLAELGRTLTGRTLAGKRSVVRWEGSPTGGDNIIPASIELLIELLLRSAEARALLGLTLDPAELMPAQRQRLGLTHPRAGK